MVYTNIAFYYFFRIEDDLEVLRVQIKARAKHLGLRGSILIAREGVNLMVSGEPESTEKFKGFLREWIGKDDLFFKESTSSHIPFNRIIVKAKKQIVPVDDPSIRPDEFTAPYVKPEELKKWYDQNKDMIVIDTRNDFEYNIGTFKNAHPSSIDNFRDFEKQVDQFPQDWKDKTVVVFCTGGIRCEKASPIMLKKGYKNVYQLDGGILNYFEKIGGEHYNGDCFVFDRRVALNSKLEETDMVECYNCRHPVTKKEQELETYKIEVSCPYCYDQTSNES